MNALRRLAAWLTNPHHGHDQDHDQDRQAAARAAAEGTFADWMLAEDDAFALPGLIADAVLEALHTYDTHHDDPPFP